MTRPAPAPGSARLAAALRELKDRTGLSLAGLAAKTTFSKSSWERYLNGKALPPRPAVQKLCRLAGEPEGRCLALWEIAKSEGSGQPDEATQPPPATPAPPLAPAPAPAPSSTPAPAPAPEPAAAAAAASGGSAPVGHRGAVAAAVLASVCAVVFGAVVLTLVLLPHPSHPPRPSATLSATGPRCQGAGCEGKDPARTNCAGSPGTLAEHVTATGASIQLRYSKVCGASWVRMWGTRIGDGAELRGRLARVRNRADADTYVHTPMTATRPGALVRACFLPAAGGRKECFEARVTQSSEPTPRPPTSHSSTR